MCDITETRPIQCYKKLPNLDEEEAQLQFCRFTDDICVYAELTHEDGQLSIINDSLLTDISR